MRRPSPEVWIPATFDPPTPVRVRLVCPNCTETVCTLTTPRIDWFEAECPDCGLEVDHHTTLAVESPEDLERDSPLPEVPDEDAREQALTTHWEDVLEEHRSKSDSVRGEAMAQFVGDRFTEFAAACGWDWTPDQRRR